MSQDDIYIISEGVNETIIGEFIKTHLQDNNKKVEAIIDTRKKSLISEND